MLEKKQAFWIEKNDLCGVIPRQSSIADIFPYRYGVSIETSEYLNGRLRFPLFYAQGRRLRMAFG